MDWQHTRLASQQVWHCNFVKRHRRQHPLVPGVLRCESQPLDGLRVDFKQACNVVHLLCEDMGIRANH
jgi:hypothetical protein